MKIKNIWKIIDGILNKKVPLIIVLLIIAGYFYVGLHAGIQREKEHVNDLYPRTAVVVEIDRPGDTVVCEDSTGTLWAFYGAEDWCLGDGVSMIMDSRGTDSIYDDEIVTVRYSAWDLERSD